MVTETPSTVRARRLRERRSRGVAMIAPVEIGEGGLGLRVSNGLLKEHETRDRKAVFHARAPDCLGFERGAGCRHDAFELEQAIDRRLFAYDDQIDSADGEQIARKKYARELPPLSANELVRLGDTRNMETIGVGIGKRNSVGFSFSL